MHVLLRVVQLCISKSGMGNALISNSQGDLPGEQTPELCSRDEVARRALYTERRSASHTGMSTASGALHTETITQLLSMSLTSRTSV